MNLVTRIPNWIQYVYLADVIAELSPLMTRHPAAFGHQRPRSEAWFHLDGAPYTYSGTTLRPMGWPPLLKTVLGFLYRDGHDVNSVLVNLYRDGRDYVPWHADDEPGISGAIPTVSFGATRRISFRSKIERREGKRIVDFNLAHGDLLVMEDGCQDEWEHCVRKTTRPVGPRVSLTFRRFDP